MVNHVQKAKENSEDDDEAGVVAPPQQKQIIAQQSSQAAPNVGYEYDQNGKPVGENKPEQVK